MIERFPWDCCFRDGDRYPATVGCAAFVGSRDGSEVGIGWNRPFRKRKQKHWCQAKAVELVEMIDFPEKANTVTLVLGKGFGGTGTLRMRP